jgi:hypothetical protein
MAFYFVAEAVAQLPAAVIRQTWQLLHTSSSHIFLREAATQSPAASQGQKNTAAAAIIIYSTIASSAC